LPNFDKERLQDASPLEAVLGLEQVSPDLAKGLPDKNLDKVLVRGVAWTAGVKWLTQLVTWGTTVVVARLLVPSDYGLVGMAAIYINLFTLFSEFGIGTAVVTIQDLTEKQISQLNSVAFFLGVLGSAISAAAAVPLGKFFRAPNLPLVVIVLSCGFIVSGLRTVPYALLQRELRFRLLAVIEGLQWVVQASLTLILAFLGFRYWALVLGILSFSITPTVFTLIRRRQGFAVPTYSSIRKAIHYSRDVVIGRLCWASYNDSDFIIAGRVLGAAPLGVYTLAWTLAHSPLEKLTNLVNRVTPSVFAKIQTDPVALRRYLRNITGGMALIIFPVTVGMAIVAHEFVPLVLGAKWIGLIAPLQLLVLHALVRSNVILLEPLLNAIGEERLLMWNSMGVMIVLPITFYIGSHWGTIGIAAGWVMVYPLTQVLLFARVFRRIHLPRAEYLATMWPALSACAVMAVSVDALKWISGDWPLYAYLCAEIIVGAVAYGAVLLLAHRDYLLEIRELLRAST
jgi:O-antigen/teichoic acid export membrane protein